MSEHLDELVRYIGFDEADGARLRELHPVLSPSFPAIAARFYEAVRADPGAAAVLTGPEQVERLRLTLIDWMSSGLLGPYDDRFYDKRSRIGRRHVAIGLSPHYMFTAMNVIRTAYLDRIAELYPSEEALALMRSVGKLLDIEIAIPEHVRSRMYEPFFSTKESGTGLGMSIVHSLVALHGGAIELETGPNGTRFDVAIPRQQ